MVRQLVAKLRQKRKGIILINAVLASIIVGLVGIALASIYSGMFSTMSAGKAGSQGEQMAAVETSVIKMKGYDESDSVTHGWKDMSDLVGEDGKQWESKVTLERTKTTDDGNTVKVMKVAVRKTGDLISRYSAEVPLVEGLDVYSKDEIDQMFTTLNSQISQLSSDLDAFKKETADNFTNIINNINQINANLDDLQKMINAETQARVDADKAISNNLSNETKARQNADAALSNQIDSLKSSLTDLRAALNTEISNRQAADSKLQGNINSEAAARKDADNKLQNNINSEVNARKEAINNLQAQINSKYEELYNLYKGLKSRLDGNEFVKSKDALNSIALKYEQKDGESTKSLHGYVDGVEVPLASQNKVTKAVADISVSDTKLHIIYSDGTSKDMDMPPATSLRLPITKGWQIGGWWYDRDYEPTDYFEFTSFYVGPHSSAVSGFWHFGGSGRKVSVPADY